MGLSDRLDSLIGIISPEWELHRKAARRASAAYDAVGTWRNSGDWQPIEGRGEQLNAPNRKAARNKARHLERNSESVNSILKALKRDIVGRGFSLQVRTKDTDWNNAVEDLWREWCRPGNCDITGKYSLTEILKMIVQRKFVDGAAIILKTYDKTRAIPFQLQLIEVDDLEGPMDKMKAENGNLIVDGVEIDKNGKHVAYWLSQYDYAQMTAAPPKRYEASQVFYLANYTRPSDIREVTELARSLNSDKDLDEFFEAVVFKQKINAAVAAWITSPKDSMMIGNSRINTQGQQGTPEAKRLVPGSVQYLDPGQDVKTLVPNGQASELREFSVASQRKIAASHGLSYEITSRDVSQVNYSSARQNLLEDWKEFEAEQSFLVEHFLDFVFEEVIKSANLSGAIKTPKDYETSPSKYLKHEFIGCGMPWIDPNKEASANTEMLNSGQTTLKDIYAKKGKDWEEEIAQLALEKQAMKQAGLIQDDQQKGDMNNA